MAGLDAFAVASLIEEIGTRLELKGDSDFKVRAYYRAAETLRELEESLESVIASGQLRELAGIGDALAEKITVLHQNGVHPTLERLRSEVPDGLLDLMRVPGLGPKRIRQLHAELNVQDMDSLAQVLAEGRLEGIKGFGGKTIVRLREALEFVRLSAHQLLLPQADIAIENAFQEIQHRAEVIEICPAGELRRRCEQVAELRLVAATRRGDLLPERVGAHPGARVVPAHPAEFGLVLLYQTGSEEHLRQLEARAERRGLSLSPQGLFRDAEPLPVAAEKEIYEALGLPWLEPEWREGNGELEAADEGRLPVPLQAIDIRGLLHCHTRFSDGVNTLEEMAEASRALGMTYLGVADHSQSAFYAQGLDEERIREQHRQMDALNERYAGRGVPFRVFKGIESDIREDGTLDYSDEVLARFDFVVASVHSHFQLDEAQQTERVLRAIAHPSTTILGHPTGRLLRRREGLKLNLERILDGCAEHGVVVELNAHPERLDLDWRWHARVLERGLLLSINPDSHATGELAQYRLGVEIARKGRVPAERVLNSRDSGALAGFFAARKRR
jgi:DNA polymerase (family 10)